MQTMKIKNELTPEDWERLIGIPPEPPEENDFLAEVISTSSDTLIPFGCTIVDFLLGEEHYALHDYPTDRPVEEIILSEDWELKLNAGVLM